MVGYGDGKKLAIISFKKGIFVGWDWFISISLFIAVAGLTPGPNNIIAMSIGFNHGYRKVLPHLFGVLIGFPVMLLLIGLILRPLMEQYTTAFLLLKYASIAYVFYLAWQIATTPTNEEILSQKRITPITFWQSVAYQWINPKAWAGALTTINVYIIPKYYWMSLLIAVMLSMLSIFVAILMWTLIGKQIKRFLMHPQHVRIFNISMAVLLLIAVGMMV